MVQLFVYRLLKCHSSPWLLPDTTGSVSPTLVSSAVLMGGSTMEVVCDIGKELVVDSLPSKYQLKCSAGTSKEFLTPSDSRNL